MMRVCTRPGCARTSAPHGDLCQYHLDIVARGAQPRQKPTPKPTPKQPASTALTFVDAPPAKQTGRRADITVDSDVAQQLRGHPGQWAEYPVEARWTDWGDASDKTRLSRLRQLGTRINRSAEPYGPGFTASLRQGSLWISYTGEEDGQ